jgi:hypothetical protein
VPAGFASDATKISSVGSWQLRDDNGDLLVDGRYQNDLPQGKWTLWHANGRKAAEGDVFRGGRTGVWRVWDERGTMRSEVTYRAVQAPRPATWSSQPVSLPVTGTGTGFMMIGPGPVGQMAPPFQPPPPQPLPDPNRFLSQRHGPCRVWYASGQLQLEGKYADDRRDGWWTYYDEQGNVHEQGSYKADVCEGEWTSPLAGTKPGPGVLGVDAAAASPGPGLVPAKVTYIAGRTRAEHEALLARLRADLASGSIRRQVAAATRLEELGPAGVPLLAGLLETGSDQAKILALRALLRMDALRAEDLQIIEPLTEHADPRLALRATLAIHHLSPPSRQRLYPRIVELIEQAPSDEIKIEALVQICNLDSERRILAFMSLMELLARDSSPDDRYLQSNLISIRQLQIDPVPLLAAAFGHTDRNVRLVVLQVLEQIVESGPAQQSAGAAAEITWPIPSAIQPVIDRARADADPEVRQQAEEIGTQSFGGRGGGFF